MRLKNFQADDFKETLNLNQLSPFINFDEIYIPRKKFLCLDKIKFHKMIEIVSFIHFFTD